MKKRRKTEGIYSHSRESWDPSIRSRFESSLPAKGDPRTNEKSPSADFPRLVSIGPERSSGTPEEESRCKTWLRLNTIPLPPSSEIANSFSARGAPNHPGNTLFWPIRSPRIHLSIGSTDSRACVGRWRCESCATANLDAHASSHVFMNVCGYVWERIAEIRIFSKDSRRERERERWSGGRSRRTAWACRFVFEEISLRIDKIGDDNKKFPSFEIKWFDRCFLSLFGCSKRRKEESLRKKNESSTRSIEGNEV